MIKTRAGTRSESINSFINRAIDEAIERDSDDSEASEGPLQSN